jgi:hypothetical protein
MLRAMQSVAVRTSGAMTALRCCADIGAAAFGSVSGLVATLITSAAAANGARIIDLPLRPRILSRSDLHRHAKKPAARARRGEIVRGVDFESHGGQADIPRPPLATCRPP